MRMSAAIASESPAPTAAPLIPATTGLSQRCRNTSRSRPIETSASGDRVRLDVTVNNDDMGRVIGRRGRVASAIRTVVGAAAAKDGVTTEVEFVE